MHSIQFYRKSIFKRENMLMFGFWCLVFFLFFVNTFHEKYPDEFDNILGGWYMLGGHPIYSGFFTHHGPVAYFLAALLEVVSGQSFVRFRILYALFLFVFTLWSYIFLRTRFGKEKTYSYLLFVFALALSQIYFWGQMLLADNISGFFLIPVFVLIFLRMFYKTKYVLSDFVAISILTALALLSSLTFTYLILFIYAFVIVKYLFDNHWKLLSKNNVKVAVKDTYICSDSFIKISGIADSTNCIYYEITTDFSFINITIFNNNQSGVINFFE